MDKKIYKYIGILVGLLVLIVIVVWLGSLLTGGGKLSYVEIETKLVKAAKEYAEDHPAILPTENGTSMTLSSTVLINNGYIKELSSYSSDSNTVCNGSVEIYLTEGNFYNYVPNFNCGTKYKTIRLYDKVLTDNDYGVVTGSGLYERRNGKFITNYEDLGSDDYTSLEYVFRGDEVNNFVKIDNNYWRIVAINEDNDMLLIYVGYIQKNSAWDDRYNAEYNKNQGINIYEQDGIKSRAMESVEKFYNGEVVLVDKEEYSPKTRYLTVPMNLCVGKRSTTETDISGAIECKKTLENQYAGLLPAYYYMSASLDVDCDSIVSKNCGNYNYLSQFDDYWWLLTANSENTNEAYSISKKYADSNLCSYKSSIRPTIMLGSRVVYESGIGTQADPYTIKFYE